MNELLQNLSLTLEILIYSFTLWLGLYLISRNLSDTRLRLAGLGMVAYALGLALDVFISRAVEAHLIARMTTWQQPFLYLPALFWLGLLFRLAPPDMTFRTWIQRHPRPLAVIVAATLFFVLGLGFAFFPVDWIPRPWLLAGMGVDFLLLGFAVAVLDAFDEGEALLPHMLRAFDYALLTALLFGGQVALVMVFSTGVTLPMLGLLLGTIAVAILLQTFSDPLQLMMDRLAFLSYPRIRQTRAALQTAAAASARIDDTLDLEGLADAEFARLTRRALSHLGNLPKLAASPLTRLPVVDEMLEQTNQKSAGTLERANVLRSILQESILQLKPPDQGEFGTGDAWRHYNALYFPYVLGLKPYRRRPSGELVDESAQQASEWFRREVPQRTLYNWQNAAAKLVARDLRDRSGSVS